MRGGYADHIHLWADGIRARASESETFLNRGGAPSGLPMNDVTRILARLSENDPLEAERLLPLVYDELRKLAAAKLRKEKPGQTLQPTALVHEAYLRLVGPEQAHAGRAGRIFSRPPPKRCGGF